MPELYSGTTADFLTKTTQNVIAEVVRDAFFDYYGFEAPPSEVRSWRNSLRALANAIRGGGFLDHGIFLEYQLPLTSMRLDAMITGEDTEGSPGAVIVELKQWDKVEPSVVPECVCVLYGGKLRDVLHPSAQAGQYKLYLEDSHSTFHDAQVRLSACSFIHDFRHDEASELLAPRHRNILGIYPLFAGDRVDDLISFLQDRLGKGRGLGVLRRIREGGYRPHKKLLEHVASMIEREPAYVLLDEQRVVFNSIVARASEAVDLEQKAVFVVRGGPGTGKSVLAINLVAELSGAGYNTHHATGSNAFTNTVRRIVGRRASQQFKFFNSYQSAEAHQIDVIVCDEAHRIREHSWNRFTRGRVRDPERLQIDELLAVARVAIFFIDDLQGVRRSEIGSSDYLESRAGALGIPLHEYQLEAQFRCGGSDGFVRWVENTLHVRRTANALWSGMEGFDFRIVDSPEELDRRIRERAAVGHSARLVAGYAWHWSDPLEDGTLVDDVRVDGWSRPWNAKPDAGRLAAGIPKATYWASEAGGMEQVGCIYTAQGFEFDYVGVIFGPDLVYRPRQGWIGRPAESYDQGLKRGTSIEQFTELVKNTYRVLLSRGLKGCYVHFMDEPTRDFVEGRIERPALLKVAEAAEQYGSERDRRLES